MVVTDEAPDVYALCEVKYMVPWGEKDNYDPYHDHDHEEGDHDHDHDYDQDDIDNPDELLEAHDTWVYNHAHADDNDDKPPEHPS